MDEITGTERVKEGIMLRLKTKTGEREVLFEFRDLIAMKVNVLHLLQFPHKYLCDPLAMIIIRKPRGSRKPPEKR
jgi:hypothetical protein